MRKFAKVILILGGSAIGLLILLTVAIRILFPPARLRKLVQDQIRINLHREAQLGGARLGVGGLSLDRFRLSEVPSFSAGTFLAVEHLKISWALSPLLSKQVVIREITLDKPQIHLIRMPDSKTYNISDLAVATATSGKKLSTSPGAVSKPSTAPLTPGTKAAWGWQVKQIHLSHGKISFEDRSAAHQTSALSDIDLVIRDFDSSRVQGRLSIAQLQNPVYQARDFSMEWALHGLDDPTLSHLNGSMRLTQGPGMVQNLTSLTNSSKGAKLALMPLVMLQNLDKTGVLQLGLPNFSHFPITRITGDYLFNAGLMKIQTFEIASPELSVNALGTIDLPSSKLAVNVNLHSSEKKLMGEMDLKMSISGSLSNPKTNLDDLKKKAFKATINRALKNPDSIKNLDKSLKQLFH